MSTHAVDTKQAIELQQAAAKAFVAASRARVAATGT